jgi:ABC-2 type transport system permease protein
MSTIEERPVELRDVGGPSALGGGWRRALDLLVVISTTEFKRAYFGTALGYLWALARPLMLFAVLYFVFNKIAKLGAGVHDYPVLLLMNIVLFGFFQGGTGTSITSVLTRESLVRKMHFPRLVIPVATVLTVFFNLLFNLIVVVLFMVLYGVQPKLTWLLLPVLVVVLFAFTCGIAMLLSSLYIRYRDVAPIWGVISQALYFASPVFITIDSVLVHGQTVARLYLFNPMAMILQEARHWMIGVGPGSASAAQIMGGRIWLLVPFGILCTVCALGFWVFRREAPRIAEEL